MGVSKTKIDKAGFSLARPADQTDDQILEYEYIFDDFRKSHLEPLSETTMELQRWLGDFGGSYYIAQRLKRKPQILRKLLRLSVRLSQLQDIGGSRIIVPTNADVDRLFRYLESRLTGSGGFKLVKTTDYRERGRDRTGYRALHVIISRDAVSVELQIRSRAQHFWSESIERTSVIYGHHLKEEEGDAEVLRYFKCLSDAFYELEAGREASIAEQLEIDVLREKCEKIIKDASSVDIGEGSYNEGIIKTLVDKEAGSAGLNNWILVFDWKTGSFVSWDIVGRNPNEAIEAYARNEKSFPQDDGFEVVLIGSSDVATVGLTHSHYFGIKSYDAILDSLNESIMGMERGMSIDIGARQVLNCLHRRRYWGAKAISRNTLKNHYAQHVVDFDRALTTLIERGLVLDINGLSLNLGRKAEIEKLL